MKSRKVFYRVMIILAGLILLIFLHIFYSAGFYFGAVRVHRTDLQPGNADIPHQRTIQWEKSSPLAREVINYLGQRNLPAQWNERNNVEAILLAKYILQRDLDKANEFLTRHKPWGIAGSSWFGNPKGDYDFQLPGLTAILFLFGDQEILSPAARDNLLNTLLTEDGGQPQRTVPNSSGLVPETENHILMTEGSRYLKNHWLRLHGNDSPCYDNDKNGLGQWLLNYLKELEAEGFYEFNSRPYLGCTMGALLNLHAFGDTEISDAAGNLLDRLNWYYALGSASFRRLAPFRRQSYRAGVNHLSQDAHTALVKMWMSFGPDGPERGLEGQALAAAVLPYRLPDKTARWIHSKPTPYFVRIGHGPNASPEIYSGGPGYLISSGGVFRAKHSGIARAVTKGFTDDDVASVATTLFVEDGADQLKDVLHLYGPGNDFRKWNNTGVYENFACAAGPVHIPESWKPDSENELWSIYHPASNLFVAVHSRETIGLVALFHSGNANDILNAMTKANSDETQLFRRFVWPGGATISYDLESPPDCWVITSLNGEPTDRNYDQWPMLSKNITTSTERNPD